MIGLLSLPNKPSPWICAVRAFENVVKDLLLTWLSFFQILVRSNAAESFSCKLFIDIKMAIFGTLSLIAKGFNNMGSVVR